MHVHVTSQDLRRNPVSRRMVHDTACIMLRAIGRDDAELSVLLCSDEVIQVLNRDYRDKDAPTDVLAFAMSEGEGPALHPHLLGDVVISLPTARRQASENGKSIAAEVRFLLAHGLLHLVGFDHQTMPEYRRMMAMQDVLVSAARAQLWTTSRPEP